MLKLNLGCGHDVKEGYVNVDFRATHPSVKICDLSKRPWPFATSSIDEIMMLDFLEHFPVSDTDKILLECHRIMKIDATVEIQVPDFDHVARAILQIPEFMCNRCGQKATEKFLEAGTSCVRCGQKFTEVREAGVKRLFGGQDYPGNFHQTTFTKERLEDVVCNNGFIFLRWLEEEHQKANWNIKGLFKKC